MGLVEIVLDVLQARTQAIVITVNCVGVMGAGNAKAFRKRYPHLYLEYVRQCRAGKLEPGVITPEQVYTLPDGRYAILFPTKRHWRYPSKLAWIESGLRDLRRITEQLCLDTLALPPPGAGHGKLDYELVVTKIREVFQEEDLTVMVCRM